MSGQQGCTACVARRRRACGVAAPVDHDLVQHGPPSATRMHLLARGSAYQIAPSASRQIPSGTPAPRSAQTRWPAQSAVSGDRVGGQPPTHRLAHHQRGAVGSDDGPVGELQPLRRYRYGAVWSHQRRARRGPAGPYCAGRTRSCPRRRCRLASTTMSLQWNAATPASSAWTTRLPSGSCRSRRRSCIDTISSRPSGSQPSPEGQLGDLGDGLGRTPVAGSIANTTWACMSDSHSRPSCQRGPSPNAKPSAITVGSAMSSPSARL